MRFACRIPKEKIHTDKHSWCLIIIGSWLINFVWFCKNFYGNTYRNWETAQRISQFVVYRRPWASKHSFVSMQYRALYVKTYVRCIVVRDINSPKKHCCAKLRIFTCLTVTCISTHTHTHVVPKTDQKDKQWITWTMEHVVLTCNGTCCK